MWQIDASGTVDDVTAKVTAITYDAIVADVTTRLDLAQAQYKVENSKAGDDRSRNLVSAVERFNHLTKLVADLAVAGERECFDRTKAYVLGEIKASITPFVGVTARIQEHPLSDKAKLGARIVIDISEYDNL